MIRYCPRLKIFENFLLYLVMSYQPFSKQKYCNIIPNVFYFDLFVTRYQLEKFLYLTIL